MSKNIYDVESLPIADLRKLAATMKIEAQKDWDKTMYINAINSRRKSRKVCRVVDDVDNDPLAPGFCRIRLHLTPMGTDWAVDVMVNNFKTALPRNIWVDVPREVRDTLRGSTELVPRKDTDKDGHSVIRMTPVPCYPFDQVAEAAGESGAIKPSTDAKVQTLREMYREAYGRWPRREQFEEFRKQFVDEFQKKIIKSSVDSQEA